MTIEILDEELEKTAKRIGFDTSRQLMFRRGGWAVLVKRVAKYEVPGKDGPTVLGVPVPRTLFPRGLLHSSTFWCRSSRSAYRTTGSSNTCKVKT